MRPPSVVVPGIVGQDGPQVSFAENQHPVGDLGPGGEHEPFRISIRATASPAVVVAILLGAWWLVRAVLAMRTIQRGPERAYQLNA